MSHISNGDRNRALIELMKYSCAMRGFTFKEELSAGVRVDRGARGKARRNK